MGELGGFMKHTRDTPTRRPVPVRLRDWKEVYEPYAEPKLKTQAGRCMDCGIPFCHNGCPSSGCTQQTTSQSSPGGSAQPHAKAHACLASTMSR
jgi:glutamate synthase (NADPH) small chain